MGMSGLFLALMLLLLATTVQPGKACSCGPRHPQEDFCSSDMVVTARFLSGPQLNHTLSYLQYKMEIIKKLKGFDILGGITPVPKFLTTPAQESLCSYRFKALAKGQEYLVAGLLREDQLYVTSCSFVKPWSSLSPAQRLGFKQIYASGCGCHVSECNALGDWAGKWQAGVPAEPSLCTSGAALPQCPMWCGERHPLPVDRLTDFPLGRGFPEPPPGLPAKEEWLLLLALPEHGGPTANDLSWPLPPFSLFLSPNKSWPVKSIETKPVVLFGCVTCG
uniref:Metalloproteinase inhibitor 1 n=1 Tax=Monodelphis domestica TaxID=13616 RepID=A0A5F8GXW8_MONDO